MKKEHKKQINHTITDKQGIPFGFFTTDKWETGQRKRDYALQKFCFGFPSSREC